MASSHLRKYQTKKQALGLCLLCPKKATRLFYCATHFKEQLKLARTIEIVKPKKGIKPRQPSRCSWCNQPGHKKPNCEMFDPFLDGER